MAQTLFDRIWDAHVAARRADGRDLVYMDRHVLHELHAPHAFAKLRETGRGVPRADLTFACQDHTISTSPGRGDGDTPQASAFIRAMRAGTREFGIRLFDVDDPQQGISHVVAPELGIVLPGSTYACPDSHACSVGGLGAIGVGCGTSELEHVLATQVVAMKRPKTFRVRLDGTLAAGVTAKDAMLRVIGDCGVDAGRGYAIEFAGSAVRAMSVEGRLTMCNMTIEMGARSGFIAPDDTTFAWLEGRPHVPAGRDWEVALGQWRMLKSDDDASFDREVVIDCAALEPQISWGTDPSHVIGVSERVPDPADATEGRRGAMQSALRYMDLAPGMALDGLPIDRVFIGSCTNGRLPDLEAAAEVLRGRRVADGVTAFAVPGSTTVKREAEAKGLDRLFRDAGFLWGEPGCSMCASCNGDRGEAGERCVSTTNRNFENRQGVGVRTHLAGPAMPAAAAVAGRIVDVRRLLAGEG